MCREFFHEKINKVQKCIEDNTFLVFVNGVRVNEEPNYIILNGQQIARYTKKASDEFGIKRMYKDGKQVPKDCYRYKLEWVDELWRPLPSLKGIKLPDMYQDFVKLLK